MSKEFMVKYVAKKSQYSILKKIMVKYVEKKVIVQYVEKKDIVQYVEKKNIVQYVEKIHGKVC